MRQEFTKGTWFYRSVDKDNFDLIRLERIKNEDCFVFTRDRNYRDKFKLTKEEFDQYTMINPHGYFTATTVVLDSGLKDVICTLHRASDINNDDSIPYAVCRQSILDIFANLAKREDDTNVYIGLSMSKDTCPPDIDYVVMLLAKETLHSSAMAVYLDDSIDDIMHYIPTSRYNEVLMNMPQLQLDPSIGHQSVGHCFTLRQLLDYTEFIYDFKSGFGVQLLDTTLELNEDGIMSEESIDAIQNALGFILYDPFGIEYGYDIDFNTIANDYVIVSDKSKKTYVVSYVKGEDIDKATRDRVQSRMEYIASLKNILN